MAIVLARYKNETCVIAESKLIGHLRIHTLQTPSGILDVNTKDLEIISIDNLPVSISKVQSSTIKPRRGEGTSIGPSNT